MAKPFRPGGHKGKLHRELGIAEGETIPQGRLESAEHSSDPEIRRDAIRAKTMEGWHHGGHRRHSADHGRGSGAGRVGHR